LKEISQMKTKVSVAIVSLLFLLSLSGVAFAARGGCCSGGGGPAIWNELSPEQKQQALSIKTEFMKKQEAVRSEMAQKRIELMELTSKDKPDEQAIEKKRQEMWALQDTMRNERRAMSTKFRSLLTPEQRQKFGAVGMGLGSGFGQGGGCAGGGGCGGFCGGPGFSGSGVGGGGRGCGGCGLRSSNM
jgi:Spy/CpxP family protein refolding chaperone